jgi:hypothetical protein
MNIQGVAGRKVSIQGGRSIAHSKQENVWLKWQIYRVFQGEKSIFWEVIISVILNRKLYMYMCPIVNGFRDGAISLYRRAIRHVLTRVAKCIDVDGGIFANVRLPYKSWMEVWLNCEFARKCISVSELCFLLTLLPCSVFHPENGSNIFLRYISDHPPDYTASHCRW